MTAVLSWHVQNFVVIWSQGIELLHKKGFQSDLNCAWRNAGEMYPASQRHVPRRTPDSHKEQMLSHCVTCRRNNIRENISTHCGLVMPYGELSGTTLVQAMAWCIAWGQPEGDFRINTWAIISNINLQITDLKFYLYLPGNTDFIQKQEKKPASPSNFFNFFGVYCIDSEKQHWFWQWVGIIQM